MGSKAGVTYFNMGPWPVFVGFTCTPGAVERELKRLKITDDAPSGCSPRANATTHFLYDRSSLICIIEMPPQSRRNTREQYAALVAHEALHVVQEIRDELNKGACLGKEAESYLVQQIVQDSLQIAWASGRIRNTEPTAIAPK